MKLIPLIKSSILCIIGLASCSRHNASFERDVPSAEDMVILQVEMPADLFMTWVEIKVPNLEKKPPSPIKVPKSATVISKGKPVTCSDKKEPDEGEFAYVTDGVKDGNEGYSVVISEGPQWVRIDLGDTHLIDAVVLWYCFLPERVVNDVIVQVSDDPEFKIRVTTLFNNDSDNTSGQGIGTDRPYIEKYTGRQIAGNGTKARYIRTWSNGDTQHKMNEFIEVEVWGRPTP